MSEMKWQTEFDVLRLLAILAVIAMHAGGNKYLSGNFDPRQHSMFVAAIVWCVPVFFLISGRFFLDPQRSVTVEKNMEKVCRPHRDSLCCLVKRIYDLLCEKRRL